MIPTRQRPAAPVAVRDGYCAQCTERLGAQTPSRWWCSEDCYFEWQRTQAPWTVSPSRDAA